MGARTGGFALPSYTTTGNTTFLGDGAGEGNRTLVFSLEGCCSTIELHPRQGLPNTAGRRSQLPKINCLRDGFQRLPGPTNSRWFLPTRLPLTTPELPPILKSSATNERR